MIGTAVQHRGEHHRFIDIEADLVLISSVPEE
jgi:hypothetical protein